MSRNESSNRLKAKSILHAIQVELQQGYDLSPVEAQVLAQRVEQMVDQQLGHTRQTGQITYQAIAMEEPPGKALHDCRKVPVHLTVNAPEDHQTWAIKGAEELRRVRVHRLVYEARCRGVC